MTASTLYICFDWQLKNYFLGQEKISKLKFQTICHPSASIDKRPDDSQDHRYISSRKCKTIFINLDGLNASLEVLKIQR